jgi:L-asparaginase
VRRLLAIANVEYPFEVVEALRKDSLELTDGDRETLCRSVTGLKTSRVVVTHGTDTMTLSAARLASVQGRTIVLTGALTPARFRESDASFNLGMAFATAQVALPGVYIVMNGQVFAAGSVKKDRGAGTVCPGPVGGVRSERVSVFRDMAPLTDTCVTGNMRGRRLEIA